MKSTLFLILITYVLGECCNEFKYNRLYISRHWTLLFRMLLLVWWWMVLRDLLLLLYCNSHHFICLDNCLCSLSCVVFLLKEKDRWKIKKNSWFSSKSIKRGCCSWEKIGKTHWTRTNSRIKIWSTLNHNERCRNIEWSIVNYLMLFLITLIVPILS